MRNPLRLGILVTCLVLILLPVSAQGSDPMGALLTLVNQARHDNALPPYALTQHLLGIAAQRHADDLAANQASSHTGSDGTTPERRAADAGYQAWRTDAGEATVGELIWVGPGTPADAMAFFMAEPVARERILSAVYREIGTGIASDGQGFNYYVLVFAARPNVLPIFINEGAINTEIPDVVVWLTNEEARPGGQGSSMGQAIEIRIGNDPNWDILPWQPWEALVFWSLPNTVGRHTVYVQYRDAANRTATSADSIWLGDDPPPTPPLGALAPGAAGTPTPEGGVAPADQTPTTRPTATPPPITVTPFPTWTPLPTPTAPPEPTDPNPPPIGLIAGLQGLALLLGLFLALHRGWRVQEARVQDESEDGQR